MPWPMSPPPTTPILCSAIQPSTCRVAAVHVHHLTGAEIRCWRKQVDCHADEVLDLSQPPERDARERARPRLLPELIVAIHPGGELRPKHGRRNGVHGDAVLGPLGREHTR